MYLLELIFRFSFSFFFFPFTQRASELLTRKKPDLQYFSRHVCCIPIYAYTSLLGSGRRRVYVLELYLGYEYVVGVGV